MASLAPAPAYEERPRRPRPPSRKVAVSRQRRMAGSVVWICAIAVLLAGIVAINVAVLRLNVRLDELSRDRARLRNDIAALQSRTASAASSSRIQAAAGRRGLAPVDSEHTTYVDIAP